MNVNKRQQGKEEISCEEGIRGPRTRHKRLERETVPNA
jgi:hypothetical protein